MQKIPKGTQRFFSSALCILRSAFESAPKALSAMHLLGKQASLVQFRVGTPFP